MDSDAVALMMERLNFSTDMLTAIAEQLKS